MTVSHDRRWVGHRDRNKVLHAAVLACAMAAPIVMGACSSRSAATAQQEVGTEQPVTAADYYELGRAYETGQGVPQDLVRATELYREASRRGEARASERLGLLAARGEIDTADGLTYDRLVAASLRNSPAAELELARLRLTGAEGVTRDIDAAVATLENLVRDNNAGAMVDLADLYSDPTFGRTDYARAVSLLREASLRGATEAAVRLARLYADPSTSIANRDEAMTWARSAIDRGDPRGWLVIGQLSGDPTRPGFDASTAESAFRHAMDSGVPGAQVGLAKLFEASGQPLQALAIYDQLISAGQRDLGYEAGRVLDDGGGTRRGEAYTYLEMAAAAGRDAAPRRLLGLLEDDVADPDGNRAPSLAMVAAWADAQNDPDVHYRVGRVYESASADIRDPRMALSYYRRAADGGRQDAALRAARLVQRTPSLAGSAGAADYLLQAANLGDIDALTDLGRLQESRGDVAGAAQSYLRAAAAGDGDAAVRLARLAEANPGTIDDDALRQALERGAELGNSDARVRLADLLLAGTSPDNIQTALTLLQRAAEQGNAGALRRLGDLAADGTAGMTTADAIAYYEQALRAGDNRSGYRLLRAVARNSDSRDDYQRAVDLARSSSAADDPTAQYWLGVLLMKLDRPREAFEMLVSAHSGGADGAFDELLTLSDSDSTLAAELQSRLAATGAGSCALGRVDLVRAEQAQRDGDSGDAAELYLRALQTGWYVAAERLGGLSMAGLGTGQPDLPMAFAYFAIASDADIQGAREQMDNVASALTPAQREDADGARARLTATLGASCND